MPTWEFLDYVQTLYVPIVQRNECFCIVIYRDGGMRLYLAETSGWLKWLVNWKVHGRKRSWLKLNCCTGVSRHGVSMQDKITARRWLINRLKELNIGGTRFTCRHFILEGIQRRLKSGNALDTSSPSCSMQVMKGVGESKTQLSLCLFCYADDMFWPLWAILRAQKYIMREKHTV